MPVHAAEFALRTQASIHVEDMTERVRDAIARSGVTHGLALVAVTHTTCAVCVNENEPGLRADLERLGREVLDPLARGGAFAHDRVDDNARAHLTAILLGHATTLAVRDGAPLLGTWQSIFLIELDGPRTRTVHVTVVGD